MVVSITLPFLTAAMLQPLPRWQVMMVVSSSFLPRNSAVESVT